MNIEEILHDDIFIENLEKAIRDNDVTSIKNLLLEKDIHANDDELKNLLSNQELDEVGLDAIAGGSQFRSLNKLLRFFTRRPNTRGGGGNNAFGGRTSGGSR